MKSSPSRSFAALGAFAVAVLFLTACPHRVPVVGPGELDAVVFLEQARKAHEKPASLTCDAKAFVDAPQNGGRYALRLAARRPAALRIEANTPLGDPAAILVTDQGKFALLDLRANVFYRGPASPENLSRLLPAPLTAPELVALLTGSFPELAGADAAVKRNGERFALTLRTQAFRDEIGLGGDLRTESVQRFDAKGTLLWSVRLEEHDDSSGTPLPRLLHLSVPSQKTEVDLRLKNLAVDLPPPSGAFLLGVPKGMEVEEVP